jgi:hypothetical protein
MFKANVNHDDPPAMPVQMVFSQFLAGRLHFGGQLLTLRHSKLKDKSLQIVGMVMKCDEFSCYQLFSVVIHGLKEALCSAWIDGSVRCE